MHLNQITPLGIENKDEYLVHMEKDGLFTALSKNDETIKTWSIATGKLLSVHNVDPELFGSAALHEYKKYEPHVRDDQENQNHLIDSHD